MKNKKSIEKNQKCNIIESKAITLISLVITIILLIILAGVAINLSIGENGLFNKAKEAKKQYINEEEYSQEKIMQLANNIDEISNNSDNKDNIKKGKLSEIIDTTDYGKTINYSANGVNDWKVFYNDGTNIFIITTDYLENSLIPNNIGIGVGGKYGVYFKNVNNKQAAEILTNKNNWEIFSTGKGAKEAYRSSIFRYVYSELDCKRIH